MEWAIQITKKTHFLKFIVDPHLDIKSHFIYFSFFNCLLQVLYISTLLLLWVGRSMANVLPLLFVNIQTTFHYHDYFILSHVYTVREGNQ